MNEGLQWVWLVALTGYAGWQHWHVLETAKKDKAAHDRQVKVIAKVAEMRAAGHTGRSLLRQRLSMKE